jgi:hypothetical protein
MVPEQAAALQALAVISGREAAQAVSRLIVRGVVQGPSAESGGEYGCTDWLDPAD